MGSTCVLGVSFHLPWMRELIGSRVWYLIPRRIPKAARLEAAKAPEKAAAGGRKSLAERMAEKHGIALST